jgi:hypothetical protein
MCAIIISVATSQFSHCYLYSGTRKKKVGHYFLNNLRNIYALFMELHTNSHGVGVVAASSMGVEEHVRRCYEWHAGNMTV